MIRVFLVAMLAIMLTVKSNCGYGSSVYIQPDTRERQNDNLSSAMAVSASAMQAQGERMKVITQNMANSNVTGGDPDSNPYRRKRIFFTNVYSPKVKCSVVKVDKIDQDPSDFVLKYQPNHPAADAQGYVKYPNVYEIIEMADMQEAKRSFEANSIALSSTKESRNRVLELLR